MGTRQCICSGFDSYIKNGFDSKGRQRYKCKYCGRSYSMKNELKPLPTDLVYRTQLTKEELYCLGFLYADGWVADNKLGICVQEKDREIIDLIKHTFNLPNKITEITRKDGRRHVQMIFRISYFKEDLYHLGFNPHRTDNAVWLPYMESPHFIRGYLDGNGSIYLEDNSLKVSFTNDTYKFIAAIQNYIIKLTNLKHRTVYPKGSSGVYLIRYSGKEANHLASILYKDSEGIRLKRKYDIYERNLQ